MTNLSRYAWRSAESERQKPTGEVMELHEIRYFLAVRRTLNFTRAAEHCHVSQPALTRAIQKMEGELGGLLFCRERNNVHLTELGRMLEPHLSEMILRAEAAKDTAKRFLRLDNAPLRVGVMCSIGPARFVDFLARFRATHPGVDITLTEAVPDRLCELLERGALDLTLMARPDGFAESLQPQLLYRERFVIACAAGHPIARRNVVRVAELDGQSWLSRIDCEYRDMLGETCAANGARLVRGFRSDREDWILTMVAAGMGICFLPEYSNTIPGVVSRPVIDPPIEREVCLLTAAGRRWSSPLSAFVQAVRQYSWPERQVHLSRYAGEVEGATAHEGEGPTARTSLTSFPPTFHPCKPSALANSATR
ncbi:MAG TPA: LysR family transcriptional regulator [Acetobacteraceae bacterium]|nr:LysR family transcriptional regulator [Acetobacteraceae bacterium]